jgi:hypothetical protein
LGLISKITINTGDVLDATAFNKLWDDAYTEINGNIEAANITDGSITAAKIANANVTAAKFATQIDWANTQSVAFQEASSWVTGGTANNEEFTGVFTRLGNIGAATVLTGIANGRNGRFIILYNPNAFNLTIANQHASSDAANRIITCTGEDATSTEACTAMLIYSSTDSRWILLNLWG